MKTLQDLKNRGIDLTDEIKLMVLLEIVDRMEGKTDGILHEPLSQIIANQYTIVKLKNCVSEGES